MDETQPKHASHSEDDATSPVPDSGADGSPQSPILFDDDTSIDDASSAAAADGNDDPAQDDVQVAEDVDHELKKRGVIATKLRTLFSKLSRWPLSHHPSSILVGPTEQAASSATYDERDWEDSPKGGSEEAPRLNESLVRPHEAVQTDDTVVSQLETLSVVKWAPQLRDVAQDERRTTPITRIKQSKPSYGADAAWNDETITETEREAAADLVRFLEQYIEAAGHSGGADPQCVAYARDILDNLTFIGHGEREEAVRGIATYWKSRLRANPQLQICVIAGMRRGKKVKSGEYLLESILDQFSDTELDEFEGRLTTELDDLTADPQDVMVIMLDDWIISGSQMTDSIYEVKNKVEAAGYGDCIEINLLTSPRHRIERGFGYRETRIPIKSYFLSHDASIPTHYPDHACYETGAHSSVDYDFEAEVIQNIVRDAARLGHPKHGTTKRIMPGLTNIVRRYRKDDLDRVEDLEERNDRLDERTGV